MPRILAALAAGLLFGLGLIVSGMVNPEKVLGFLDVAGDWDPSLAFVMAAAIPVAALGFRLGGRMKAPICGIAFTPPARRQVDARLLGGAALFGIGWGLAGFCPGPALASLGFGDWQVLVFVVAMLGGMGLYHLTVGAGRGGASGTGQAVARPG
ncbi:DUF6691 family protein [Belnapia rosea]|uniref:Sulphur transport domain-containing protein n=1 Tax=Belnapia rosea TaxID=938405 RepID=A0A1G7DBU3_9PROT|nr:DUF6691 family protein [Belnapia rosea]SDE49138.1 hypothetical protein SAMN04487779_10437 [Belnapia rosea]